MVLKFWDNFVASGIEEKGYSSKMRTVIFINSFSVVGILSFFIFGTINLLESNLLIGVFEVLFGVIAVFNLIYLRISLNSVFSSYLILVMMVSILTLLVVTGGINNTGIFWVFTFPVLTFYLLRGSAAISWVIAMSLIILGFFIAEMSQVDITSFEALELRQLFFAFIAVSILVYLSSKIIRNSELILEKNKEELTKALEKSQDAEENASKALEMLKNKTQDLEKMNQLMIGRELKMVSLKEKLKNKET